MASATLPPALPCPACGLAARIDIDGSTFVSCPNCYECEYDSQGPFNNGMHGAHHSRPGEAIAEWNEKVEEYIAEHDAADAGHVSADSRATHVDAAEGCDE